MPEADRLKQAMRIQAPKIAALVDHVAPSDGPGLTGLDASRGSPGDPLAVKSVTK